MAKAAVFCPPCGEIFDISLMMERPEPVPVDIGLLPKGVMLGSLPGGFIVRASCRNWGALFIVPFTIVWAGGSMSGFWNTFFSKGFFLWPTLISLPFVLGSAFLICLSALSLAGSTIVKASDGRGEASLGVGFLRRRRAFDPGEVRDVEYSSDYNRRGSTPSANIVLHGERRVRVILPPGEERSRAFFNLIRQELLRYREGSRGMQ